MFKSKTHHHRSSLQWYIPEIRNKYKIVVQSNDLFEGMSTNDFNNYIHLWNPILLLQNRKVSTNAFTSKITMAIVSDIRLGLHVLHRSVHNWIVKTICCSMTFKLVISISIIHSPLWYEQNREISNMPFSTDQTQYHLNPLEHIYYILQQSHRE